MAHTASPAGRRALRVPGRPTAGRHPCTLRAVSRLNGAVRTSAERALWLVVALVVAIGGAGIVAAVDHVPGTPGRPELTSTADAAAMRALDASTALLDRMTEDVITLSNRGRFALAAMTGQDFERLDAAILDGTKLVTTIDGDVAELRTSLGAVPGIGPNDVLVLSEGVRARYDVLAGTLATVDDLSTDWRRLVVGVTGATRLISLLELQEQEAAAAAGEGKARRWGAALVHLDKADAALDEAATIRDRLANVADVSTLTRWIERNREYDEALAALYTALQASRGQPTDEVREAFAAERRAFERLPADTTGLVVIMADIARGGLNQAVIAIELARGDLEAALVESQETEAGPLPTPPA